MSGFTQTGAMTVLIGAGALVRYGFYTVAFFVFGMIAWGIVALLGAWPKMVEGPPSFRINDSELAALSNRTEIVTVAGARSEARHYGQLYDRERDFTVILMSPAAGGFFPARGFEEELAAIPLLRRSRGALLPTFYDLETRFGSVRAAEMRIRSDGKHKLCLAFLSRFESSAVTLKGWLCEGSGAKPSSDGLACMLNQLVLEKPLPSAEATAFLRERMKRSGPCYAAPLTQTTDTRPPRRQSQRRY
jgi:hypothetical protein